MFCLFLLCLPSHFVCMTFDIIAIPLLQWRSGWNGGGMVYGQIIDNRIKGRGWNGPSVVHTLTSYCYYVTVVG